eukprot:gb/GEZN01018589.1/.p1 GENE.gb/GEZN01018589.1/~~gb/GEZN01018589.1/.p1  ORF type:complete len:116 (-),score=6.44 gb/GEZN01018589.1/:20-367(-)
MSRQVQFTLVRLSEEEKKGKVEWTMVSMRVSGEPSFGRGWVRRTDPNAKPSRVAPSDKRTSNVEQYTRTQIQTVRLAVTQWSLLQSLSRLNSLRVCFSSSSPDASTSTQLLVVAH